MDEIEHRLERIAGAIADLAKSVDLRFGAIERRLTEVEHRLSSISDRLGRQVAVTEALRSDMRLFASIAQGMLGAVQGFAGAAADLSGRVTDLENRAEG